MMKKIKSGVLVMISLVFLTFCRSRYFVDLSKISFQDIWLKKIEGTDSLQLNFELKIAPKSVGKRSITVILPMIIDKSDTLKFNTITLAGEGDWDDCMNIPYKYPTTRSYSGFGKNFSRNISKTDIIFRITTINKKNILKRELIQITSDSVNVLKTN